MRDRPSVAGAGAQTGSARIIAPSASVSSRTPGSIAASVTWACPSTRPCGRSRCSGTAIGPRCRRRDGGGASKAGSSTCPSLNPHRGRSTMATSRFRHSPEAGRLAGNQVARRRAEGVTARSPGGLRSSTRPTSRSSRSRARASTSSKTAPASANDFAWKASRTVACTFIALLRGGDGAPSLTRARAGIQVRRARDVSASRLASWPSCASQSGGQPAVAWRVLSLSSAEAGLGNACWACGVSTIPRSSAPQRSCASVASGPELKSRPSGAVNGLAP